MHVSWKEHAGIDSTVIALQSARGESVLRDFIAQAQDFENVAAFMNPKLARAEVARTRSWWASSGVGVTDLLVIGIGGSTLASKAVLGALNTKERTTAVRFLEGVDAEEHDSLTKYFSSVSPESFFVLVISKSGSTIEVLANLAFVEKVFTRIHHKSPRIGVITLPDTPLASRAAKGSWPHLSTHNEIPDRFAAFTVTGLVPLVAAGVDIDQFAASVTKDETDKSDISVAAIRALSYHAGNRVHDLFYFHPELEALGKWHRALMAESLGKAETVEGHPAHIALEPVVSVGTQDLHAVLQLRFGSGGGTFTSFVVTHDLMSSDSGVGGVLFQSIQETYVERKLPFITYVLNEVSESEIGAYMTHAMRETAVLASFLEVNPFDQPEVEGYKERARERMDEQIKK